MVYAFPVGVCDDARVRAGAKQQLGALQLALGARDEQRSCPRLELRVELRARCHEQPHARLVPWAALLRRFEERHRAVVLAHVGVCPVLQRPARRHDVSLPAIDHERRAAVWLAQVLIDVCARADE